MNWRRQMAGLYTATVAGVEWTLTHNPDETAGYQWAAETPIEGIATVYGRSKAAVSAEILLLHTVKSGQ